MMYIYLPHNIKYMDDCMRGRNRVRRASVADNITLFYNLRSYHSPCLLARLLSLTTTCCCCISILCDNLPPDVLGHLCNNKLIITDTKAIPDNSAMGVGVDSMNMSDHVEFDTPQASDLAETIVKRLLEGIPLT